MPELNQETGSESESGSGKGMGVGIVGGSRHHAEAELIRQSSQCNVPQWTGVRLRGKEFGRLANYEKGKPRLGWEPGGSTIYLQKKKSSNPRTRQQFMKCNPPISTPQASDQPIPSESTKVTPQKLNNQQTVARTTHK